MGSLDHVTVIDCTSALGGPLAAGALADHGARVVRVEPPAAGGGGEPPAYAVYNRGKESLLLDLGAEAGREAFWRVLAGADVLVENWPRAVAAARGMDWEALHARFPALVVCTISGYGLGSPDNVRPAEESLVLARLGLMAEQAGVRAGGPHFFGAPMTEYGAGNLAVIGILAALYRRGIDGAGRLVETSLADGAVSQISMHWQWAERGAARTGASITGRILNKSYRCADGGYIGVHTAAVGGHGRLMELTGLADRIAPAKGTVEMAEPLTPEEAAIREEELPRVFATRTVAEWEEALMAADVCGIPLLPPAGVFDHAQARHNEMTVVTDDPVFGPLTQVGIPGKLSRSPGAIRGPRPRPGQHTEAALGAAGLGAAEVAALRAAGVVA